MEYEITDQPGDNPCQVWQKPEMLGSIRKAASRVEFLPDCAINIPEQEHG